MTKGKPAEDKMKRLSNLSKKSRWNRNGHLVCEVKKISTKVRQPDLSDLPSTLPDRVVHIVTDYRCGDTPRQIAKRYNARYEFVFNICQQYGKEPCQTTQHN